MILETGKLYHIYNQGNNRQRIFYCRKNYLYFLKKVNLYILPYADILAWCLMPNHFHLMICVHTFVIQINDQKEENLITGTIRNLNDSIGLLLRTYTRGINKQNNRSGSIFKTHTHAECLNDIKGIKPEFLNLINKEENDGLFSEEEYPQICFIYIHNNPVKAKLVDKPEDWEFSSYIDYCGLRNGKLINRNRAKSIGLHLNPEK